MLNEILRRVSTAANQEFLSLNRSEMGSLNKDAQQHAEKKCRSIQQRLIILSSMTLWIN